MKNAVSHSITARLVMLLCLLGLSSFSLAADTKADARTDTKVTPTASQASAKPTASAVQTSAVQTSATVNINTASAEEIASKLKGIGLKKAQAIVAYREANGQFTSKEGLTAVKGIGDSTLMQNSELISLK